MNNPLILVILDGWGLRDDPTDNAIAQAHTPNYDFFLSHYPHAAIDASGHAVGLPEGVMGNSEVGHLNIGAGRVAQVGLTRIYGAIEDGSFFKNPQLVSGFQTAKKNNSTLHLMGLVSDGAVHSHQDHLFALLKMAAQQGLEKVAVHAFTDGRDTDPHGGVEFMGLLQEKIREIGVGQVATVSGRFYAMDRDKRWDRIQRSYEAMVLGEGKTSNDPVRAIRQAYEKNETDEFIDPTVIIDEKGNPRAKIQDKDAVIFFNFRADRAREMTYALTDSQFKGFERKIFPKLSRFVCMAEYDGGLPVEVAFPPVFLKEIFPEIISQCGLKQLRIAETEKYAHVTFFFNGGEDKIYPGEERVLIPSPRDVATYDLRPEMSALEVGGRVLESIHSKKFDVIILNFANADMVGHSGKLAPTIRAVETVDQQLGEIYRAIAEQNGTMILTADHGNAELMRDPKGKPHTAHTTDLVPFILIGEKWRETKLRPLGVLADIAPTLLYILGIPQPKVMTGRNMMITP